MLDFTDFIYIKKCRPVDKIMKLRDRNKTFLGKKKINKLVDIFI